MAVIKWGEKSHHKHHYIFTYFNFGHQHVKFYTYDCMNNTTSWNIWCIITAQTSFHTEYFFFFKYFVKSYIRIFFCTKNKIRLVASFSGLFIFNCRLKHFWHLRHRIWYCFDNYFTYFIPVFKYCYSDSRNLWTVMRAGGLAIQNLIQPTISSEMPVPSQGHYGFHSFPVVDWFFLFI